VGKQGVEEGVGNGDILNLEEKIIEEEEKQEDDKFKSNELISK